MKNEYFALVSSEITEAERVALEADFDVIALPPDAEIALPVRSHPDMILSVIGDRLILSANYHEQNRTLINRIASQSGLSVVASAHPRSEKYPHDVGFNVAVTGSHLICNVARTAPEILRAAEHCGLTVLDVRQGYTGCSCITTDDLVITSDVGIYRACEASGVDVAHISNVGISLPGYNVGFIGGSGGFCGGTLYLYGDTRGTECEAALVNIAERYGYRIKSLSDGRLTDRGGIKFIKYKKV